MKIILAIVGRGHWGKIYLQTISGMKNVVLPEKYILGRDYKSVLTKKMSSKVDGVIIASPAPTHLEVARALIKNGYKNLLIEKPMTHSPSSAAELVKLEKLSRAHLMVGHVQLYDPGYVAMKNFAKKYLGKFVQINYYGLQSPPTSASVLQDWGPHPISVFLDLINSKPKKITAKKGKYDNIQLRIEFENKVKAIALIGTQYPERKREIQIIGERGKLTLNGFMNPRDLVFISKSGKTRSVEFGDRSPLEMQISQFAKLIKPGAIPRTPISQGYRVVKIISLAEESLGKS